MYFSDPRTPEIFLDLWTFLGGGVLLIPGIYAISDLDSKVAGRLLRG